MRFAQSEGRFYGSEPEKSKNDAWSANKLKDRVEQQQEQEKQVRLQSVFKALRAVRI